MSTGWAGPLLTVTFGDLDDGLWGATWGAAQPAVAIGLVEGAHESFVGARIVGASAAEEWQISADGVELVIAPAGDAATLAPGGLPAGFEQLCRASGRCLVGGVERTVNCLGRRGCSERTPDCGRFESLRDVSAWFEAGDGVALRSLRRRKARGHADDLVTAVVFEPEGPVAVADPRLSTTYTAAGPPSRMNLELWIDQDQRSGGDGDRAQYPRRVGGEALGDCSIESSEGTEIQVVPLRCHSRGHEGSGMYLLASTQS
jgi:hypothetical protein